MTVYLEIAGRYFGNWTAVEVERSMEHLCGTFKFDYVSDYKEPFPIKRGAPCRVVINGEPVITGYVDRITVAYDASRHLLQVIGRDRTMDVVDSKIDHRIHLIPPITLEQVCQKTLENINATDISVINLAPDIEPFRKEEIVAAHVGRSAFDYIECYARKRQVLVTTDGHGNLVLTKKTKSGASFRLQNEIDNDMNNIKAASVEYDDSKRFNEYSFYSQGNPSADPMLEDSPHQLTARADTFFDTEIRESRTFREICESSTKKEGSQHKIKKRAEWEARIRRAKALKYTATVVGHSSTDQGTPYKPNTIGQVSDVFADIEDELLLTKVTYRLSLDHGSETDLELIPPDAFDDGEGDAGSKKGQDGKGRYAPYDNSVESFKKDLAAERAANAAKIK